MLPAAKQRAGRGNVSFFRDTSAGHTGRVITFCPFDGNAFTCVGVGIRGTGFPFIASPYAVDSSSPSGVQADRLEVTIDGYPYTVSHSHRGTFWQTTRIVDDLENAITSGARAIHGVDVIQDGNAIKILHLNGATLESARLYRYDTGAYVDVPVYPSEHKILIAGTTGQSDMPVSGGVGGGTPQGPIDYGDRAVIHDL